MKLECLWPWRMVRRRFTNLERKRRLEEVFRKSSVTNRDINYSDDGRLAPLRLPAEISHWECNLRLNMEDGKTVGYYLGAIARFSEYRNTSTHVAGIFDIDGSLRSAYRMEVACSTNGAYLPAAAQEKQWSAESGGDALFATLIDAILNSVSPPPKDRGK